MPDTTLYRALFGATVSLHYLFPLITIGGSFVGLLWVLFRKHLNLDHFGRHIQLMGAAVLMGILSGYALEFQLLKVWAGYSEVLHQVYGNAIANEGLLSAGCLTLSWGILRWGHKREQYAFLVVGSSMLFASTLISSFYIVSLNSWMQHPDGVLLMSNPFGAELIVDDPNAIFWNPTYLPRLQHVLLGAGLVGAGYGLWILGRIPKMARAFGVLLGILTLVQWASGHDSAQQAAQYQPEKFAAFEGHFEPYGPADLVLVGQPDEETHQTKGIKLPGFASWLLYGKTDQDVIGLDAYNARMQPDWVQGAFQSYHLMVTVGGLLLLFAAGLMIGPVSWLKSVSVWVLPLALFGNLVGWMAAEVGRQPWAIRGILTTEDALGDPSKPLWLLAVSLLLIAGCLGLAVGLGRSLVATRKAIA